MSDFVMISAVDHIIEPPDLWMARLPKAKFGERIPHVERLANGADCWLIDNRRYPLSDVLNVGALLKDRAGSVKCWDEVPKAAYDRSERLQAMDRDGVDYSILYPTVAGFSGARFGAIADLELQLACVRAYNDWLIDKWASQSPRFIAQCLVPLSPIDNAVAEIKRAVERGHRGVIFPAAPMHLGDLPHINDGAYDPIWATCEALGVPLCIHAGSAPELCQFPLAPNLAPELAAALTAVSRPASAVFDLTNILFSRILLRFPQLKVVFAESSIGWGTYLLEYADHQYEQDHCDYPLKPSEMFHRQCFLTSWYDDANINSRHIGADNILWSTNFPAANSTWPDTKQFADKCLSGMNDSAKQKILWGNMVKLYKVSST